MPPAGEEGHKGIEVSLDPYIKNPEIFMSPFDKGGPYTSLDVPGADSYWKAYGSSFRFTQCLYTVVSGFSTQNNVPRTDNRRVTETMVEYPAETRALRLEMMPWFSNEVDTTCYRYGYDCPAPYNYFTMWNSTGGSVIYVDGHAKFTVSAGQFDDQRVDVEGHRSGEYHPTSWSGTWYAECD